MDRNEVFPAIPEVAQQFELEVSGFLADSVVGELDASEDGRRLQLAPYLAELRMFQTHLAPAQRTVVHVHWQTWKFRTMQHSFYHQRGTFRPEFFQQHK